MLSRITRSKTKLSPKKQPDFKPGFYVWAKIDKKFWPAIIVSHRDMRFNPPSDGKSWLFWFGDDRVSEVRHSVMKDFCEEFKVRFTRSHRKYMSKEWITGVFEAIREIGLPATETLTKRELVLWGKTNLTTTYIQKYIVTDFVKEKLDKIRNLNFRQDPEVFKESANHFTRKIIENYQAGKVSTLNFCLGCYGDKMAEEHPIFFGYFCVDCKERYKERFLKVDECSRKMFCVICGFGGDVIICKDDNCKFIYCSQCIRDLVSVDAYDTLCNKKIWFCFICHENKNNRGALIVKSNWRENIAALFSKKNKSIPIIRDYKGETSILETHANIKPVMEAIAKFGDKSGLYYSEDLEKDCMKVTEGNYPEIKILFNSLTQLTEKKYQLSSPVNLFICHHQSNEKDVQSPSDVLYEFHRILKILEVLNTPFFWLFIWPADISLQEQVIVTRLLQYHPILTETGKELVWSNIFYESADINHCLKNVLLTDPTCYEPSNQSF